MCTFIQKDPPSTRRERWEEREREIWYMCLRKSAMRLSSVLLVTHGQGSTASGKNALPGHFLRWVKAQKHCRMFPVELILHVQIYIRFTRMYIRCWARRAGRTSHPTKELHTASRIKLTRVKKNYLHWGFLLGDSFQQHCCLFDDVPAWQLDSRWQPLSRRHVGTSSNITFNPEYGFWSLGW